jgi:hypothetical protein
MEQALYVLEENYQWYNQECLAPCFSRRIQLPIERYTALKSVFSSERNINFLQDCQIQVKGRSTVSLLRKPLMLEARGSSMLFTSEN